MEVLLMGELKHCPHCNRDLPLEAFNKNNDFDEDEFDQRERHSVIWQMLVEMFGDCGTSPRFGWIEKRKECAEFLREIMNAQYIN